MTIKCPYCGTKNYSYFGQCFNCGEFLNSVPLETVIDDFLRDQESSKGVQKMEFSTKYARHMALCKKLNDVYRQKNHDYGDTFHQSFAEEGLAMARIRLGDKFGRFKNLSKLDKAAVQDESLRDTLLDLANYSIMTVLEMDDEKRNFKKGGKS